MRERYVRPRPERFRLFNFGREILRLREHRLIYLICFFQPLFYLSASWFVPTLATTTLGLTKAAYGRAFAVGSVVTLACALPLGWLFSRYPVRRAACIGCCLFALLPNTWALLFMRDATGIAIFFALRELMFNVYRMNFYPLVMEYTTPQNAATIIGFTTATNGAERFTALPLLGKMVDVCGGNYFLPFYASYVGVAVCVLAFLVMRPASKVPELAGATAD